MTNGTARSHIVLEIDEVLCCVCAECRAKQTCRGNAIRIIDRDDTPFVDMSRCWGCMVCIAACPCEAVVRREEKRAG